MQRVTTALLWEGSTDVNIAVNTQEKLMTIIEHLQDQNQRIDSLFAQVTDLEKTEVCTGRIYWRDSDTPGKTPKMCVIHSVNNSCPLHGKPKPDSRIHIYVGIDPEKQHQILQAIECQRRKARLESQIRQTEVRLRRIERAIDDVWRIVTDQQRWEW